MSDTRSVYVFIDASNLWEAQKSKGQLFDFQKLKKYLQQTYAATNLQIFYYTAYPAEGTRDYSLDGRHRFYTYLKKGLEFNIRKKKLKQIHVSTDEGELIEEKGNMDVEMTIDAIHNVDKYDTAVLFSGDSDFLSLVTYLQHANKTVYIFSSQNNVSRELKTGGDGYTDILKIKEDIWGNQLKHRKKTQN